MGRQDHATVQDRIVALIHERQLAPGSLLPAEPRLMDVLDASRNSVREALRALQALGIVEIRHGHGTFVSAGSLSALAPSLAYQLRSRPAHDLGAVHDLIEVREVIETGLIGTVAERGPVDDQLSALDRLVEAMADDPGADRAFHALLYQGTGNQIVLQLIGLFWDSYHAVEDLLGAPEGPLADIIDNHRQIVAALRDADPEAARTAMRVHFTDIRQRVNRAEEAARSS